MIHARTHILNTAVDSTLKNGSNGMFYYVFLNNKKLESQIC